MANKKRLIDVCAEIRKIDECLAERKEQADSLTYRIFESVKTALEKAPTVDAVEVVRCKDCRWFNTKKLQDRGICDHPTTGILIPEENDFCSYGIKKDGDGNGL